jgi:hypothetical protein
MSRRGATPNRVGLLSFSEVAKMSKGKCFACDRRLGRNPYRAVTADKQIVFVGSECYKNIKDESGYQPPKGGPKLYAGVFSPSGELLEVLK